jgi:hypothetical protein
MVLFSFVLSRIHTFVHFSKYSNKNNLVIIIFWLRWAWFFVGGVILVHIKLLCTDGHHSGGFFRNWKNTYITKLCHKKRSQSMFSKFSFTFNLLSIALTKTDTDGTKKKTTVKFYCKNLNLLSDRYCIVFAEKCLK